MNLSRFRIGLRPLVAILMAVLVLVLAVRWTGNRLTGQAGSSCGASPTLEYFNSIGATQSIINGNDGYVWAADFFNKKAVRLETRGSTNLANFSINNGGTAPAFMTVGPNDADGKTLWITSRDQKIATKFSIFRQTGTVYPLTDNPAYMDASAPAIAKGSDGNLWFTEPFYDKGKIGKMTPTGEVTHYDLPPYSNPEAITAGPDGNIWFLDAVHPGGTTESFVSKVGKIAPSGTITEYTLPAGYTVGGSITAGPDGNIWFMGLDMVGKISTQLGHSTFFHFSAFASGDLPSPVGR
jgi:virginiamycin B lyase